MTNSWPPQVFTGCLPHATMLDLAGRRFPSAKIDRSVEWLRSVLRQRQILFVLALTAAAAALRFTTLGLQSFWYDETVTVSLVQKPLVAMLRALPGSETTPPFYYLVAWPWARIFGSSEFPLRALSAVAGTATIPVVYAAGRAFVSRRAGLAVAAFAAFSPILIWYSQEARAYSLLVLVSALSFLFFARAWEEPTRPLLIYWSLFSALAIATYYFAAFLIAAEFVALLLRHGRRRHLWLASAGPIGVTALVLPLAAYQARTGNASWIHSLPLSLRVEETLRQLTTPAPAPLWAGAGIAEYNTRGRWLFALALLAVALAALIFVAQKRERLRGLLALGVAAVVLIAPLLLSLAAHVFLGDHGDIFLYRGLLPAWLPLAIFVAAGLAVPRTGVIGVAAVSALCAASLWLVIQIDLDRSLQRDDWHALALAVNTTCETVVVVSPAYEAHALLHYRPDLRRTPPNGARADKLLVLHRRWTPGAARRPAGFHPTAFQQVQYWTLRTFRAPQVVHISAGALAAEAGPPPASATALEVAQSRCA